MSTLATTNLKHASSGSNNIVLDSGGGATFSQIKGGAITSGTAVASTSGTSIDFTSIPSWVKRITVMFNGISTNGTSPYLVQLGTSSGATTSGYTSGYSGITSTSAYSGTNTAGFGFAVNGNAANVLRGCMIIENITGNNWIARSHVSYATGGGNETSSGSIGLASTLDRVRITTVNGTDTFDAGTINILYEG